MSDTYNPEEDGIFVCTECGSPLSNPMNNIFAQAGEMPACKACGGLCMYVENPADADEAIRQHNVVERHLNL